MYDNHAAQAVAPGPAYTLPAPAAVPAGVDRLDFSAVIHNAVQIPHT